MRRPLHISVCVCVLKIKVIKRGQRLRRCRRRCRRCRRVHCSLSAAAHVFVVV